MDGALLDGTDTFLAFYITVSEFSLSPEVTCRTVQVFLCKECIYLLTRLKCWPSDALVLTRLIWVRRENMLRKRHFHGFHHYSHRSKQSAGHAPVVSTLFERVVFLS